MENSVETLCINKEKELLDKYFGNLIEDAAVIQPETIGEYSKDLPKKIEEEFRDFLKEVWKQYSDKPLVLEEEKLRNLMTEADREDVNSAYKDAKRITLWERITKSNHKDVTFYKGLLYEYTKEILMLTRIDFLEEITGKYINCKTFED